MDEKWPGNWQAKFEDKYFRLIIILRLLRPDKVLAAIQVLIKRELDEKYIKPPPFDLAESVGNAPPCTPIIFILSSGADPMSELRKYATIALSKNFNKRFHAISLGDGQNKKAEKLINDGVSEGY